MLWTYARGDQSLRLETRFDNDTQEFILITHSPDGTQRQIERFKDSTSFRQRLVAVENELASEKWQLDGAPVLLRDGWKI